VPGRARARVSVVGRSRRRVDRSFASTLMPFLSSDSRPVFPFRPFVRRSGPRCRRRISAEFYRGLYLTCSASAATASRPAPGPVEAEPARLDRSVHLRVRLRAHFQLPGGLVSRLLFRLFAVLPHLLFPSCRVYYRDRHA
jgi:hypothetical protein